MNDGNIKTVPPGRLDEIDGMRGWAALIVVLFHFIEEMFSHVSPSIEHPLIASILDGRLPVLIFFILSGDALSSAYFRKYDASAVDRLLVKRYFRLTVPIFLSCGLIVVLMRMGYTFHTEAAAILHREEWLGEFLKIDATLPRLFRYSLIDVYANHTRSKSFNPMLWTMSVEMVGSMLVFLACYSWARLRRPAATVAIIASFLMIIGSMYSLFFVGMGFSWARRMGYLDVLRNMQKVSILIWFALLFSVGLNVLFWVNSAPIMFYMLLAVVLVLCVYANDTLRKIFSNKLSRYMGDISFPLYLTHFAILISILSFGVLATYHASGAVSLTNVWPWIAGSIAAALVLATLFRAVEKRILFYIDRMVVQILA